MSESSPNAAAFVDEVEERVLPNPRLLDPSQTPEALKRFLFGVGCPCPTRTMSRDTALALKNLAYPMFGSPVHYSPDSLEVGDARNQIVEQAIRDGCKYIFFLDYDVTPPPTALIKLLSLNVDIAAGVVFLKQVPSLPMIQVKGWQHAFDEWEIGDLIKAQGSGMGCTLIKTEVFKKIPKPWFRTVPGYSKNDPGQQLPLYTEDLYFCEKAVAAGFEITVDTSVQCGHVDAQTGIEYRAIPDPNSPRKWNPGWVYRQGEQTIVELVASADHPGAKWANIDLPSYDGKIDAIDLGSGGSPTAGYVGIDLYAKGVDVLNGDATDLAWFRKEHGLVSKIRAAHFLEHVSHTSTVGALRDWVKTLKPGGELEIIVPDLEGHMRSFLKNIDEGNDVGPDGADNEYHLATIYGWQVGPGQEHKTGFTTRRLEQLAKSIGLVDVKVDRMEGMIPANVVNGAPTECWQLRLTARKRGKRPGGE